MEKKIVITGIGVLAPNGIGKEDYWNALKQGQSGIKPITIFDPSFYKTKLAGEISNFTPEAYLGPKGLKNLDRATKLLCCAAKMALEDSKFQVTEDNSEDIGVVTGTTLSFWSIAEMSREIVADGPQYTTAGIFAGTTMNSGSSQVSIRHNIKGFNTTISTGYTASLDALKYAMNFIKLNRVNAVLVAGVEGLTFPIYTGFYKIGFLAGLNGIELSCPFDKRRNGIILSEAACVILIEDEESALARKASIYGELASVENSFFAYRAVKYDPQGRALKKSMYKALYKANLQEEEIDCILASANSVQSQDAIEAMAIKQVFNIYSSKIPVSAIKSMLGESVSVSGLLQVIAAIGSLQQSFIPPTINLEEIDPKSNPGFVPKVLNNMNVDNILINNFGPGGNSVSTIIKRY